MNNELICTPVMLPAAKNDIIKGRIMRSDDDTPNPGRLHLSNNDTAISGGFKSITPQHLYLVSSERPKEGDYRYHEDIGIAKFNGFDANEDDKKVIATTDKSLSLPPIPTSFIEEYVAKQGRIDKVRVFLPQEAHLHAIYGDERYLEVIILPIEDKAYSLSDMEKAFEGGYMEGDTGKSYRSSFFKTWLDTHY